MTPAPKSGSAGNLARKGTSSLSTTSGNASGDPGAFSHRLDREMCAAEHAFFVKIGDRAGAKKVWEELRAATNACLAAELAEFVNKDAE